MRPFPLPGRAHDSPGLPAFSPPLRFAAPPVLPALGIHVPVTFATEAYAPFAPTTSSRVSTPAVVRLRRFSRPWRFSPPSALWCISTTHTRGVRFAPFPGPGLLGPKAALPDSEGQATTREPPGRPVPRHHRGGVPFRATAPPRRTVRLRLPSPFASTSVRCPPAFPPEGGRQTFARLRRRPVARSATSTAPPKWCCRGSLASAPFQGLPLPRVLALFYVLPNTRVSPARVGRSFCGASAASVPTRCAPVQCRSHATVRSRLPTSTCCLSRSAAAEATAIQTRQPACRLRGLVFT